MFSIGIDIHGVLDADPQFWIAIAKSVKKGFGKVHILSGRHWDIDIQKQLLEYNNGIKWWDSYFSIEDYLESKHLPYMIDTKGGKIYDIDAWNRSKAEYCKENMIDIHFDDSDVYEKFFETRYFRVTPLTPKREITKAMELMLLEIIGDIIKKK